MLYFVQQRMVAARAAVSPTMSPPQQKLMQYLPVVFAVFQVFFLTGLIIYYMAQAILRIGQQAYITRKFYGHEESLGRQAQRAGDQAREIAKQDGGTAAAVACSGRPSATSRPRRPTPRSKGRTSRRSAAGQEGSQGHRAAPRSRRRRSGRPRRRAGRRRPGRPPRRPTPSSSSGRPGGSRAKSGGKRRR